MGFGPDLNGHTGWEETVYKFRIPVDNPEIVDKAFRVLGDWMDGLIYHRDPESERKRILKICAVNTPLLSAASDYCKY
jgi:zinc protease